MSICVNAHCLMLEVLRYIALNALNTVQKIKAMSKMLKIHYTDFNALKAMYVEDVEDEKRIHTHMFGFSIQKKFWKAET